MLHAYCDAGLWNEADSTFVALDNPKHRFLAPAFERDLLVRFFPDGDWGRPPLWPGFGRYRSLAICLEMLGQFDDALLVYRAADAGLRGDALIALGRLQPFLDQAQAAHPWQMLWRAYRAHALCLGGRLGEALALAQAAVPMDVYEWVHIFECLLRLGKLNLLDLGSLLYRPPFAAEQRWGELARRRMRADYVRITGEPGALATGGDHDADLGAEYRDIPPRLRPAAACRMSGALTLPWLWTLAAEPRQAGRGHCHGPRHPGTGPAARHGDRGNRRSGIDGGGYGQKRRISGTGYEG